MECDKCGKPYMSGLEFVYTDEGFFCITCAKKCDDGKEEIENL